MPSGGDKLWFENEFGTAEPRPFAACQALFTLSADGQQLTSSANGRTFHVGPFGTPSVAELRAQLAALPRPHAAGGSGLTFANITANAKTLHLDAANAGAVFQVASQFNCLEMVSPGERPEDGITRYALDHTQGPVCAMACPAATVYRNYFWGDPPGQAGGADKQIDGARDIEALVLSGSGRKGPYWRMSNGYLMPVDTAAMGELGQRLKTEGVNDTELNPTGSEPEPELEPELEPQSQGACPSTSGLAAAGMELQALEESVGMPSGSLAAAVHGALRVGVHWDTEVARSRKAPSEPRHRVCQVFSSAVPVAYAKSTTSANWATFASAILRATFEATLLTGAILARQRGQRVTVYLTSVGGGAFGNRSQWLVAAIHFALTAWRAEAIDVRLVHYKGVRGDFSKLEDEFGPKGKKKKKTGGAKKTMK